MEDLGTEAGHFNLPYMTPYLMDPLFNGSDSFIHAGQLLNSIKDKVKEAATKHSMLQEKICSTCAARANRW